MHRDVRQLSGPKRQTGAMELDAQLSPGQMAPITQGPLDDPGRTIHHVRIETQLAIVARHPAVHLGTG
jgi:hypothetical protein